MTSRVFVRTELWDGQMIHYIIQGMIYVESLECEVSRWYF